MAELRIGSPRYFDRGLEAVVDEAAPGEALVLPDAQALTPASFAQSPALAALWRTDNLEALLEACICPELNEREVLAPHRFRDAMSRALEQFRRAAEACRETDPAQGRMLDGAAGVVEDDIELRGLLQMYCGALLQG